MINLEKNISQTTIDLFKYKPNDDLYKYRILMEPTIVVYNTKPCGIIYTSHVPEATLYDRGRLNPNFYSTKRREKLTWEYKQGVIVKNFLICVALIIPITLLMLGIIALITYFIPMFELAIMLGILLYMGVSLSWMTLTDKFEIETWQIADRKKKIKHTK